MTDPSDAPRTPTAPSAVPEQAPAPHEQVSVRRAPKISAFLIVGGFLGFVGTLIATSLYEADPSLGFTTLLAYFSLYGISMGVLLGAVVAIVVDRRSRRRARTVDAAREQVDPTPLEGEVED